MPVSSSVCGQARKGRREQEVQGKKPRRVMRRTEKSGRPCDEAGRAKRVPEIKSAPRRTATTSCACASQSGLRGARVQSRQIGDGQGTVGADKPEEKQNRNEGMPPEALSLLSCTPERSPVAQVYPFVYVVTRFTSSITRCSYYELVSIPLETKNGVS